MLPLNREFLLKLIVPTPIFPEMIDTKCVLFNVLILTLDLDKWSIRVNHLNRGIKKEHFEDQTKTCVNALQSFIDDSLEITLLRK
jgi:hypothetical protein